MKKLERTAYSDEVLTTTSFERERKIYNHAVALLNALETQDFHDESLITNLRQALIGAGVAREVESERFYVNGRNIHLVATGQRVCVAYEPGWARAAAAELNRLWKEKDNE